MKRFVKIALDLIVAVCFIGIVIQGVKLGMHYYDASLNQSLNNNIREQAHRPVESQGQISKTENGEMEPGQMAYISPIDFASLESLNPEIVAWLEIENTQIDYPILWHPEEEDYYTKYNFQNEKNRHGAIFFGKDCGEENSDSHRIIYGHHMKDGTMFAELMQYRSVEFAKEHSTIHIYWPDCQVDYQVVTAFVTDVSEDNGNAFYYSEYLDKSEESESYLHEKLQSKAMYDLGLEWKESDELLFLSTCEYSTDNGRFVVVAKRREK